MAPKVFIILCLCLMVALVAAEAAYLDEEARDGNLTSLEQCDGRFCRGERPCHECCRHNHHIEDKLAGDDEEKQHEAINNLCKCYHEVNQRAHEE